MSIKGSPRQWFDAAIARRDAGGAWAAAHELGQLNLPDALALCLLLRDQHPTLYQRAAGLSVVDPPVGRVCPGCTLQDMTLRARGFVEPGASGGGACRECFADSLAG